MSASLPKTIPVCSYADGLIGPRFGIRSEHTTAGNRAPHRHDYFEILFFASSGARQHISLREYVSRRGSLFYISPMKPHQMCFSELDECFVIYFDLGFLRPDLASYGDIDLELLARAPELAPFVYQEEIDFELSDAEVKRYLDLCQNMLAQSVKSSMFATEIIRADLVHLLAEVSQRYELRIRELMQQRPPSGGSERHVKSVIKYIDANLKSKISLSEAASAVAVSPNYLASLLKRETGSTFVELLTRKRMEAACELLAFTSMRVTEVAYECSFDDFDYFCRRFKQVVGCTPLEHRKNHSVSRVRSPAPFEVLPA